MPCGLRTNHRLVAVSIIVLLTADPDENVLEGDFCRGETAHGDTGVDQFLQHRCFIRGVGNGKFGAVPVPNGDLVVRGRWDASGRLGPDNATAELTACRRRLCTGSHLQRTCLLMPTTAGETNVSQLLWIAMCIILSSRDNDMRCCSGDETISDFPVSEYLLVERPTAS